MVHFFLMHKEIFLGMLISLALACMGPHLIENPKPWDENSPESQRAELKQSAEEISRQYHYRIGEKKFSNDCSGFIGAVLYRNGIDVFKGATVLEMKGYG